MLENLHPGQLQMLLLGLDASSYVEPFLEACNAQLSGIVLINFVRVFLSLRELRRNVYNHVTVVLSQHLAYLSVSSLRRAPAFNLFPILR